jgi:hypothetical protein
MIKHLLHQKKNHKNKRHKKRHKPDPLGRKSRPTMLSKTEDFPELCSRHPKSNQNFINILFLSLKNLPKILSDIFLARRSFKLCL